MLLRSLRNDMRAFLDITIAIDVGIVFAALMVIAYIIWTLRSTLQSSATGDQHEMNASILNITGGFDLVIKIIIVAIIVAVLAIALSYLMMLRHQQ